MLKQQRIISKCNRSKCVVVVFYYDVRILHLAVIGFPISCDVRWQQGKCVVDVEPILSFYYMRHDSYMRTPKQIMCGKHLLCVGYERCSKPNPIDTIKLLIFVGCACVQCPEIALAQLRMELSLYSTHHLLIFISPFSTIYIIE